MLPRSFHEMDNIVRSSHLCPTVCCAAVNPAPRTQAGAHRPSRLSNSREHGIYCRISTLVHALASAYARPLRFCCEPAEPK